MNCNRTTMLGNIVYVFCICTNTIRVLCSKPDVLFDTNDSLLYDHRNFYVCNSTSHNVQYIDTSCFESDKTERILDFFHEENCYTTDEPVMTYSYEDCASGYIDLKTADMEQVYKAATQEYEQTVKANCWVNTAYSNAEHEPMEQNDIDDSDVAAFVYTANDETTLAQPPNPLGVIEKRNKTSEYSAEQENGRIKHRKNRNTNSTIRTVKVAKTYNNRMIYGKKNTSASQNMQTYLLPSDPVARINSIYKGVSRADIDTWYNAIIYRCFNICKVIVTENILENIDRTTTVTILKVCKDRCEVRCFIDVADKLLDKNVKASNKKLNNFAKYAAIEAMITNSITQNIDKYNKRTMNPNELTENSDLKTLVTDISRTICNTGLGKTLRLEYLGYFNHEIQSVENEIDKIYLYTYLLIRKMGYTVNNAHTNNNRLVVFLSVMKLIKCTCPVRKFQIFIDVLLPQQLADKHNWTNIVVEAYKEALNNPENDKLSVRFLCYFQVICRSIFKGHMSQDLRKMIYLMNNDKYTEMTSIICAKQLQIIRKCLMLSQ